MDIKKALKEDNMTSALEGNIKTIDLAVEELTEEYVKEHFSMDEIQEILRVINLVLSGGKGVKTAKDKELEWYRKKYNDTYRKNERATKAPEKK